MDAARCKQKNVPQSPRVTAGTRSSFGGSHVNLAVAERAREVAALPVDGVGLLRAEFMITDALDGSHPKQLIAEGKADGFVEAGAAAPPLHNGRNVS
jgi:pyruvate, water dikinase